MDEILSKNLEEEHVRPAPEFAPEESEKEFNDRGGRNKTAQAETKNIDRRNNFAADKTVNIMMFKL